MLQMLFKGQQSVQQHVCSKYSTKRELDDMAASNYRTYSLPLMTGRRNARLPPRDTSRVWLLPLAVALTVT